MTDACGMCGETDDALMTNASGTPFGVVCVACRDALEILGYVMIDQTRDEAARSIPSAQVARKARHFR